MEEKVLKDEWGVKLCPVRNKQCLENQCAWWLEEDKVCVIKKIRVPAK